MLFITFRTLNKEQFGQTIVQLSGSALAMNVCLLFAYNRYRIDNVSVCLASAVLAHYFTISTYLWISVTSYYVVRQMSVEYPMYERMFLCKRAAIAWGKRTGFYYMKNLNSSWLQYKNIKPSQR